MSKRRRKRNQRSNRAEDAESKDAAPEATPDDGKAADGGADAPSAPDESPVEPVEVPAPSETEAAEEVVSEAFPPADDAAAADGGLTVPASVLHAVQAERDEYLALAQKTRADLENYRRRVARDRDIERLQAQADLLQGILNPIDDLDRALAAAGRERNFDSLFEGLEMVRRSLWKGLGHAGFERIPAEHGDVFDPNVHEAMMKVPHPEVPENHIVEELSPGYRLGERVLRAARVMVSGGPPPEGEGDETA